MQVRKEMGEESQYKNQKIPLSIDEENFLTAVPMGTS